MPLGHLLSVTSDLVSRRAAVGLAGVAPRLVPSRGHAALIPDTSGRLCVPGLRASLAQGQWSVVVGWPCCSLQCTTPFSLSRAARALHAGVHAAVCDP